MTCIPHVWVKFRFLSSLSASFNVWWPARCFLQTEPYADPAGCVQNRTGLWKECIPGCFAAARGSWRSLGTERSYCSFCLLLQSVCVKCESSSPRGGRLVPLTRGEVWKHDEELSVPWFITSPSHLQLYSSWGWLVRRRGAWKELILQTNTFLQADVWISPQTNHFTEIFLLSCKTETPLLKRNTNILYNVLKSAFITVSTLGFTILLPATKKAGNHVITLIDFIDFLCQTHARWLPQLIILIQDGRHS